MNLNASHDLWFESVMSRMEHVMRWPRKLISKTESVKKTVSSEGDFLLVWKAVRLIDSFVDINMSLTWMG